MIKDKDMNEKIEKEYVRRVRKILKSKLNGMNSISAINSRAVSVVRYGADIIKWTKEELEKLDRKTRKLLTIHRAFHCRGDVDMYGGLHPRSNVERLYLKREDGGRGLLRVGDCIANERNSLGLYVRASSEKFIIFAKTELKLTEYIEHGLEKTRRKRRIDSRDEKTLHGQFVREAEKVADKQSWNWLKQRELKRETEGLIFATQEQAVRTTNFAIVQNVWECK